MKHWQEWTLAYTIFFPAIIANDFGRPIGSNIIAVITLPSFQPAHCKYIIPARIFRPTHRHTWCWKYASRRRRSKARCSCSCVICHSKLSFVTRLTFIASSSLPLDTHVSHSPFVFPTLPFFFLILISAVFCTWPQTFAIFRTTTEVR